jgi:hypothetical protein
MFSFYIQDVSEGGRHTTAGGIGAIKQPGQGNMLQARIFA